jgi:hypothetical protein
VVLVATMPSRSNAATTERTSSIAGSGRSGESFTRRGLAPASTSAPTIPSKCSRVWSSRSPGVLGLETFTTK